MTIKNITETAKKRAKLTEATIQNNIVEEHVLFSESTQDKEITQILDISKEVIHEFFNHASKEDQEWIIKRTKALIAEKGNRAYFSVLRSEFARRFFPELCSTKQKSKKPTLLEMLEQSYQAS